MIEGMPPKKRAMSQFMAQELLYDYVNDNLDSSRREAVDKALVDYPELAKELELISEANEYCEKLSHTKVNEELIQSLGDIKSVSKSVVTKLSWQHWPDALKWTTEAIVLSSMVIAFTMVAPWDDMRMWFVNFNQPPAEVSEPIVEKEIAQTETKVVEATDVEKKIDEPKVVSVAEKPKEEEKEVVAQPTKAPALAGTLYRMNMKVTGIEDRATEIRDKIVALGAKKAGRVRLGWRRANGNYYHFSMPAENMQKLSTTLDEYGPVRISKNPHNRVMPEGVNRIILFIEDGPVAKPTKAPVKAAPVKIKPAVTQPVEEKPVEEAPVEAKPTEAPPETTPVEAAPVEEAPVEEAPTESVPEAPVDEQETKEEDT